MHPRFLLPTLSLISLEYYQATEPAKKLLDAENVTIRTPSTQSTCGREFTENTKYLITGWYLIVSSVSLAPALDLLRARARERERDREREREREMKRERERERREMMRITGMMKRRKAVKLMSS